MVKHTKLSSVFQEEEQRLYIVIPQEFVEKLGWNKGDNIEIEESMLCYDWGEADGLMLRNLNTDNGEITNDDN